MKTMISLVSEQTVPNILAILHFKPDSLLFISTERMEREGRVRAILAVLEQRHPGLYRLNENVHVIQVQEDSILDCHRKLEHWISGREDNEFIVNLTGGTKLMSIAAFEYFKDYGSKMVYIPLGKNHYIVPFPKKSPKAPIPLPDRLSVAEYLMAYGLEVTNSHKLDQYGKTAAERMNLSRMIVWEYNEVVELLRFLGEKLREKRNIKKGVDFWFPYQPSNEKERYLLKQLGFSQRGDCYGRYLNRADISYLTGGWLEEYCFNVVREFQGEGADDVTINISIRSPQGRDNEFDVMFTSENTLYFIECKSLEQSHDRKFNILYKIGALQREFGLRVKSFLVTTSSEVIDEATGEIKSHIDERAAQFKTKVVRPTEVRDLPAILAAELRR